MWPDHFEQSDHCQAGGVDHGAHARLAQAGSGASEEFGVGVDAAEFFHHQRCVQIARGFPRRYQDFRVHLSKFNVPPCYNR